MSVCSRGRHQRAGQAFQLPNPPQQTSGAGVDGGARAARAGGAATNPSPAHLQLACGPRAWCAGHRVPDQAPRCSTAVPELQPLPLQAGGCMQRRHQLQHLTQLMRGGLERGGPGVGHAGASPHLELSESAMPAASAPLKQSSPITGSASDAASVIAPSLWCGWLVAAARLANPDTPLGGGGQGVDGWYVKADGAGGGKQGWTEWESWPPRAPMRQVLVFLSHIAARA